MQLPLNELKPLRTIASLIPPRRGGRPVHAGTLHRWRSPGIRGCRLICVRAGGIWCTTESALLDFFRALSACDSLEEQDTDSGRSTVDEQLADSGW